MEAEVYRIDEITVLRLRGSLDIVDCPKVDELLSRHLDVADVSILFLGRSSLDTEVLKIISVHNDKKPMIVVSNNSAAKKVLALNRALATAETIREAVSKLRKE